MTTKLADSSFIHGSSFLSNHDDSISKMHKSLSRGSEERLDELRLDTFANKASVSSERQYIVYLDDFGLMSNIFRSTNRSARVVGSRLKSLGTVKLQIPFSKLHLFIDVG